MAEKAILYDATRCTACRGCQIACKQWNMNPATKTTQRGTHQNPEDLNFSTYKLVDSIMYYLGLTLVLVQYLYTILKIE